jgi:hypothetical protein
MTTEEQTERTAHVVPVVDLVSVTMTTEQRDLVVHVLSIAIHDGVEPDGTQAVRDLIAGADPRDTIEYRRSLAQHLRDEHGWRHTIGELPRFETLQAIHQQGHKYEAGHPS